MNKKWNKLKEVFSENNINNFLEFVGILCLAVIATISIFGTSNFFLPDKDQVVIILTIVGLSIAYASFFVSNAKDLVEGHSKDLILKLSKILTVSPIFPIFSILLTKSKVDFGEHNMQVAMVIVFLSLLSIVVFFFCLIKLLFILLKSVFNKK